MELLPRYNRNSNNNNNNDNNNNLFCCHTVPPEEGGILFPGYFAIRSLEKPQQINVSSG